MDPYINCLLSICCPPARRHEVLTKLLVEKGVDALAAETCASVMLDCFDLAPKDTKQPLSQAEARLARGADYKA
jgi:hypothetical protein